LPANCSIKNNFPLAEIEFSLAVASDIEALLVIENQSFRSPWPRQHFQDELNQPHSFTLLARRPDTTGDDIAGYLIYWFVIDELHILNLAVSPQYRRQGIARALLCEVIRRAQEKHLQTAWLEVRPSNRAALSLYHSCGFERVMTRRRYYSDTGEDAFVLSRSL
jgi:[ribosomal protein S18]-alanine N-acetyltransferase